jgi:hypothetical protein
VVFEIQFSHHFLCVWKKYFRLKIEPMIFVNGIDAARLYMGIDEVVFDEMD